MYILKIMTPKKDVEKIFKTVEQAKRWVENHRPRGLARVFIFNQDQIVIFKVICH